MYRRAGSLIRGTQKRTMRYKFCRFHSLDVASCHSLDVTAVFNRWKHQSVSIVYTYIHITQPSVHRPGASFQFFRGQNLAKGCWGNTWPAIFLVSYPYTQASTAARGMHSVTELIELYSISSWHTPFFTNSGRQILPTWRPWHRSSLLQYSLIHSVQTAPFSSPLSPPWPSQSQNSFHLT